VRSRSTAAVGGESTSQLRVTVYKRLPQSSSSTSSTNPIPLIRFLQTRFMYPISQNREPARWYGGYPEKAGEMKWLQEEELRSTEYAAEEDAQE
jgi:hypothetical protein